MRHVINESQVAQPFARKIIHLLLKENDIRREIEAIKTLSSTPHPNIVKVWNWGPLPNTAQFHFDMELCAFSLREFIYSGDGVRQPLLQWLRVERVDYAWKIMEKVAAGLHHIHCLGLVHRDIKPENSTTVCFTLI